MLFRSGVEGCVSRRRGVGGGGWGGETGTSAATYDIIGLHYNMWMDVVKVFLFVHTSCPYPFNWSVPW